MAKSKYIPDHIPSVQDEAVTMSFRVVVEGGPNARRSSNKLSVLHAQQAEETLKRVKRRCKKLSKRYPDLDVKLLSTCTQISENGEFKLEKHDDCSILSHNCDVAVFYDSKLILVEEIKFILCSFGKNYRNYLNANIGETVNIHHYGVPCVQIVMMPDKMPALGDHNIIRYWEALSEENNHYRHYMKAWYGNGISPATECPDAIYVGVYKQPEEALSMLDDFYDYDGYLQAWNEHDDWSLVVDEQKIVEGHYFQNAYDEFMDDVARIALRQLGDPTSAPKIADAAIDDAAKAVRNLTSALKNYDLDDEQRASIEKILAEASTITPCLLDGTYEGQPS